MPLGGFGWDAALRTVAALGIRVPRPRPASATAPRRDRAVPLVGSFHPSQQNTFTGKLTPAMFEAVLRRARELADLADVAKTSTVPHARPT